MKTILLITFSLFIFYQAESQWVIRNPLPTFTSCSFIDSEKGWMVGLKGVIFYTEDGGINWEEQNSQTTEDLNSVFMVNDQLGFAVGTKGLILKTTTGGLTWDKQTSGITSTLNCIIMINYDLGWTVGNNGIILKTTTGGQIWETQNSNTTQNLLTIFMLDSLTGWTSGAVVRKTVDGKNWFEVAPGYGFSSMFFTDNQTGYGAGSSSSIRKTENGGSDWESLNLSIMFNSYSTFFTNDQTGFAVGYQNGIPPEGKILKINNAGSSSEVYTTEDNERLKSIIFTSSENGWITGEKIDVGNALYNNNSGVTLRTRNGGDSWERTSDPYDVYAFQEPTYSVDFGNGSTGYAVGLGSFRASIYKTALGGNWINQSRNTNVDIEELFSVHTIDDNTAIAVGESGTIIKTIDGGLHWLSQSSGTSNWLYSVDFANEFIGWAAGSGGKIIKTEDGGTTWNSLVSSVGYDLTSIQFDNIHLGWAAGQFGTIIKTEDGGTSWTTKTSGTTAKLSSIYFLDDQLGFAVGENGTFLKTLDGGENWEDKTFNTFYSLLDVYFVDQYKGWIVGQPIMLKTTDGGENWDEVNWTGEVGLERSLYSIDFDNNYTGWVTGYGSLILKNSTEGFLTGVYEKNIYANDIELYPNPNQGEFYIRMNNLMPNQVQIEIFNAQGQVINSTYKPISDSEYLIGQELSKCAPGVYFLKLNNGSQSFIRKFIIMGDL